MLRKVSYWVTGTRQPNVEGKCTPAELLWKLSGFPPTRDVPPLSVLNEVFRKGTRSDGFNGDTHWEPFELSPGEYDEVVQVLLAVAGYRVLESPEWIQNELDWLAYTSWKHRGVPLEPYRDVLYKLESLASAQRAARDSGSRLRFLYTTARLMAVVRRMQRLLAPYAEE